MVVSFFHAVVVDSGHIRYNLAPCPGVAHDTLEMLGLSLPEPPKTALHYSGPSTFTVRKYRHLCRVCVVRVLRHGFAPM